MSSKKKHSAGATAMLLRCTPEDVARLDALVERIPMATRSGLAREAMRLGLDVLEEDPVRLITGARHPSRLREAGHRYDSTPARRNKPQRNISPESSAHKRAAISRQRQRHGHHPFVAAVQAKHGSVSAWAQHHGLKIPTVASWYSTGALRRAIPREWAERIEAELGVPANEAVWPNGIR